MSEQERWMKQAITQARKALHNDEVPVGCVIVYQDQVIGRGYNRRETRQLPFEHAEMMAIAQACRRLKTWRLEDCTLYVTLEPCPMCAGAIIQSRIPQVVFGAYDPKGGSVTSCISLFDIPQYNHHPSYRGGVMEEECASLLKDFFRKKRQRQKEEKRRKKELELQTQHSDPAYNQKDSQKGDQ